MADRARLLIFIVAYNAERTISDVLARIPSSLGRSCDVEVLIIDDRSQDATATAAALSAAQGVCPFPVRVLSNPDNQGYGGNQKLGYRAAILSGFDYVALVHGDGQYAPECLPDLLQPLLEGRADAVFGSRMMVRGAALKGRMPLYKYLGNRILTSVQNRLLGSRLSEFHSGYRIYSIAALKAIPFHLNSQDFHFDTEIIIQLMRAHQRIIELPIPTYYGDEISHVNGLVYACNVMQQAFVAYCQNLNLFYDRKYDCGPEGGATRYPSKLNFPSPHSAVLACVPSDAKVLDLGCGDGEVGAALQAKGCEVVGVDAQRPSAPLSLRAFIQADLNDPAFAVDLSNSDYVLMLDVLEHLAEPEQFLDRLVEAAKFRPNLTFVMSTGNVAFFIVRLMLALGQFNYGKRGILDLTHKRLFTFKSFQRLLIQSGFEIQSVKGIPAPFGLLSRSERGPRLLSALNAGLIRLAPGLFSFQVFVVARLRPSMDYLLSLAGTPEADAAEVSPPPQRVDAAIRQLHPPARRAAGGS